MSHPDNKTGSTDYRHRTTMPGMRGEHREPESMFSYVSSEQRIPKDHPLRAIRALRHAGYARSTRPAAHGTGVRLVENDRLAAQSQTPRARERRLARGVCKRRV